MTPVRDYADFYPATRAQWRAWLREKHAKEPGVWFVYFKKSTGRPTVSYDEAVEEALCFGWIDSVTRKFDEDRARLLFTPRKLKSGWSKLNKTRIEKLIRTRKMTRAGLLKIEAAKRDGSWTKLDAIEKLTMPPGLKKELAGRTEARTYFEAFPPSVKKGIYWFVESAKRPETRARRIEQVVRMAAKNLRAGYDKE